MVTGTMRRFGVFLLHLLIALMATAMLRAELHAAFPAAIFRELPGLGE
jgi:hypothetical protein